MKVLNFNDPYIDSKGNVNDLGDMLSGELASQLVTNLLNPTLQSQVINGVIITNNGDGTYTLNDTSLTGFFIGLVAYTQFPSNTRLRLTGIPSDNTHGNNFRIYPEGADISGLYFDVGKGTTFTNGTSTIKITMYIGAGITFNNVVIKPMLTTDLSATYDDFVAYTGSSGTLNGDVAEFAKNAILTREYDITISSITKNTGVNQKVTDTLKNDINNGHFLGAMCHVGNTTTLTGVCVYGSGNTLSIYVKNESTTYDYTDVVLHVTVFYKI